VNLLPRRRLVKRTYEELEVNELVYMHGVLDSVEDDYGEMTIHNFDILFSSTGIAARQETETWIGGVLQK
jgi:hypothetical protein